MPEEKSGEKIKNVFIVDDEFTWVFIHSQAFSDATKYHISTFATIDEALEELRKNPPDILITDHTTPGNNKGIDAAKEAHGKGIGVVVVSTVNEIPKLLETVGCTTAKFMHKTGYSNFMISDLAETSYSEAQTLLAQIKLQQRSEASSAAHTNVTITTVKTANLSPLVDSCKAPS